MNSVPVSVVIPCYCCADTIARAVQSVAAQTRLPSEVLLIEDASPDNARTLQVLHELASRHSDRLAIRVIALAHNQGPATARNTGWAAATQPYIAFLDADDAWHPDKLRLQYEWMQAHADAVLCGHDSMVLADPPIFPAIPPRWQAEPVGKYHLLISNRLPLRSVMLKTALPFRFEPGQYYSEEYLIWLRAAWSGHQLWRLPLPLACSFKSDFGAGGLSGRLWPMQKGELNAYCTVYREKLIPAWLFAGATALSLVKFVRRCILSALSNRPNHPR